KLTWNAHMGKIVSKAKIALHTCRRAVGCTWVLKPMTTYWIYTAIIKPTTSYASIIWWDKTNQTTAQKEPNSIRRLACLCFSEAFRTTPLAVMEAVLSMPPLHLLILTEAKISAYRWRLNYPSILFRLTRHSKVF